MRDEASLRRLAEMGVDVYVPRIAAHVVAPKPAAAAAPLMQSGSATTRSDVLLLAGDLASRASRLLDDVARALRCAGITSARAGASDEASLAEAAALVAFGDAQARAAGALLPAQRQREIGWVVTREPEALAGDASGKRALWSELKRIARCIAAGPGCGLAAAAQADHRSRQP